MPTRTETTLLLRYAAAGDHEAAERLLLVVYDELHRLAEQLMRRERADHTLQPTVLADEAFVRLVHDPKIDWKSRAHFFGIAARCIRQILINHAHAHRAKKRGGDRQRVTLSDAEAPAEDRGREVDVLELDAALTELGRRDERQARIVELRFFGGLTVEQTAEVLDVSPRTVKNDWRFAKAWLRTRLGDGVDP